MRSVEEERREESGDYSGEHLSLLLVDLSIATHHMDAAGEPCTPRAAAPALDPVQHSALLLFIFDYTHDGPDGSETSNTCACAAALLLLL